MTTTVAAVTKTPRKFPPPCWTQEEALALVEAYRERWYALRRGYLRTADWDSVADAVGQRCPGATPPKTSAQCRHKMEKLRQRYRAEKQRSLSYPGRFFSSWFYFDSMDAMENGSTPGSGQLALTDQNSVPLSTVPFNSVPLGFNLKNSKKIDPNFASPNIVDLEGGVNSSGGGVRVKGINDRNFGYIFKNSSKIDAKSKNVGYGVVSNGYSSYVDGGSDEEGDNDDQFGDGLNDFRGKKLGVSGIRIKMPMDQVVQPGFRGRKFVKNEVNEFGCENGGYDAVDEDGDYWVKVPGDRNSVPVGSRGKFNGMIARNSNASFVDPRVSNGFASQGRSNFERKSGSSGVKRERNPIEEMVSSIKLLGEGFVKMEKMKMEMAKEIEKMRMDMEMKRNELLIESQRQIVDAFVKGLLENKKAKMTTVTPET